MKTLPRLIACVAMLAAFSTDAAPRSHAAKVAFARAHPCPATMAPRPSCPGWQIDHITPLKCGGPDTPANMQWLTIKAHKAKTKAEAKWCRR